MDKDRSIRRTDEQLEAILHDTGEWAIHGQRGRVLYFSASLQLAITRAADYAESGVVVAALTRSSPDIVVFPGQMECLRKIIAGHEVASLRVA
jgi:hypothetical protein